MRIYLAGEHTYPDMLKASLYSDEDLHGRNERYTRDPDGVIRGGVLDCESFSQEVYRET